MKSVANCICHSQGITLHFVFSGLILIAPYDPTDSMSKSVNYAILQINKHKTHVMLTYCQQFPDVL